MILFGISVTIVLALAAILNKRSKKLFVAQCFWLWLLCGFNAGGIDYVQNEIIYYSFGKRMFSGITEWLANILIYFSHKINLEYWQYNAVVTLFAIVVLGYTIYKHSYAPCIAMSLFYIYPMFDCVIQKRYFLSMVFCILGLGFLIEKRKAAYLIALLFAIGFHFSAIIYLPIVLIDKFFEKYTKTYVSIILGLEVILLINMETNMETLKDIFVKIQSKIQLYLYIDSYSSMAVGIAYIVLQLIFLVLLIRIEKARTKYSLEKVDAENKFIIKLNLLFCVFLPLLFLNSTFLRYFRGLQFWNYVFLSNKIKGGVKKKTVSYYAIICFVICLLLSTILIMSKGQFGIEGYMQTVFEENKVLQLIFN